jgi:hypothetical protein
VPRKSPAPKKPRRYTAAEVSALQPLIARCAVAAVKLARAGKLYSDARRRLRIDGIDRLRRAVERREDEAHRAGAALDKALVALAVPS